MIWKRCWKKRADGDVVVGRKGKGRFSYQSKRADYDDEDSLPQRDEDERSEREEPTKPVDQLHKLTGTKIDEEDDVKAVAQMVASCLLR